MSPSEAEDPGISPIPGEAVTLRNCQRQVMVQRTRHAVVAALLVVPLIGIVATPSSAAAPADRPEPSDRGVLRGRLTVVLDASGSINSSHAVDDVRNAGDALLTALDEHQLHRTGDAVRDVSPSSWRPRRRSTTPAWAPTAVSCARRSTSYYNPKPPRPSELEHPPVRRLR